MRGVDELVASLDMPLSRVLLHDTTDRPASGVEHREPRAELIGEAEEVKLLAQPTMIPSLGLLEAEEVLSERLLRLPRGAVDALELRTLLIATPIRSCHPHELEVSEPTSRRDVRASTQVGECGGVLVGRHHGTVAERVDFVGTRCHRTDDLRLEWLIGEQCQPLVDSMLGADEGLVLLDDGSHLSLDLLQIVIAEVRPARQLEVVVEAVFDDGPDGEVRPGPEPKHCLCEHVGRGVAKHLSAQGRRRRHHLDESPVGQWSIEIHLGAVDRHRECILRKALADRGSQVGTRCAGLELSGRAVRQANQNFGRHRSVSSLLMRGLLTG